MQATSLPFPNVHRYRAAQWLVDLLPEEAPNTGNDEFVYGDDMAFLSIFWMSYIPIVVLIIWLTVDWLMRRFRKFRASFHLLSQLHVHVEPWAAASNDRTNMRGRNSAVLRSNA